MIDIERIQAQLRAAVRLSHEAVAAPPFTCFFNPDNDATFANYAVPDMPVGVGVEASLRTVAEEFHLRQRRPRFEYLEAYAPDLAAVLEQQGYQCEMRSLLMVCTPDTVTPPPWPAGFTVEALTAATPIDVVQDVMTIQARAFGDPDAPRISAAEAQQFLTRFAALQLFLARFNGAPVSVATLTAPYQGIAELAGVATAAAYRRRGFAAALTYAVTQAAFAQGIDQVFLTAANAEASHAYAHAGFMACGSGLAYVLPLRL
ncbi:MAG TPA: GNAT family N-acetyltransferase [Chloroflexi bacterium]|nr:GNAT family N-acetyltransferase [Chloroflexota bacterium]